MHVHVLCGFRHDFCGHRQIPLSIFRVYFKVLGLVKRFCTVTKAEAEFCCPDMVVLKQNLSGAEMFPK
jgi:hypothetical protein